MAKQIKKDETVVTAEHDISSFTEYPFTSTGLSLGVSRINGRYPAVGFDVDTAIEQIWYVLSGKGMVLVGDTEYALSIGDMLHLSRGEKYRIDGDMQLLVASSPAWTSGQHRHST